MRSRKRRRQRRAPETGPNLNDLLNRATSSFEETFFANHAQTFLDLGERCQELISALRGMQKILRRVKEQEIIPVERRKMKRQLIRIVEFSNTHKSCDALNIADLEELLLRLEAEFSAIQPSFNILGALIDYPQLAWKGE